MPKLTVYFGPDVSRQCRSIVVERGAIVLDEALAALMPIPTLCGGALACEQCVVRVEVNGLSGPSETEVEHREAYGYGPEMRFSCQTEVLEDTVIHVPAPMEDEYTF